jgi:hypothetical protein
MKMTTQRMTTAMMTSSMSAHSWVRALMQLACTGLASACLLPQSLPRIVYLVLAGAREEEVLLGAAHQRRLRAALALLLSDDGTGGGWTHRLPDFSWEDHVRNMYEEEFKLRYRVSSFSFYKLLGIIEPELEVSNHKQAYFSRSGKPIQVATRLAVALRFFAGGDPHDLKLIYGISKSQVMLCVWRTVDALNLCLNNINFPIDDVDALQQLETDFRAATRGDFWKGQVGAIDGVHFRMRCPSAAEAKDPMRYYVARKQEYALLAIAICDYHRRFTFVDISHASCTHDSTAWEATELGQRIVAGDLPQPFFLNGDAAFTLSNSMIVPSTGDASLDDFDFYQSSNRMAIECAFGILVRRWGVLWRPLGVAFSRRAPLIVALMRMHNFCIDERLEAGREAGLPDVSDSTSEVQPGRRKRVPKFDRDGRPVRALDTCRWDDDGAPTRSQASQRGPRAHRRDLLAKAVADAHFVRQVRDDGGITRKKRRRVGGGP